MTDLEDGRVDDAHAEHRLEERVRELRLRREQRARFVRAGGDEGLYGGGEPGVSALLGLGWETQQGGYVDVPSSGS